MKTDATFRARLKRKRELKARLSSWPVEDKCWVYLLLSEYGDLYVGQTNNLRWRIWNHNAGRCRSTQGQRWRYLSIMPACSRSQAMRIEYRLQRGVEISRWVDESEVRMKKLVERYGFCRPTPSQIVHLSWRRSRERIALYSID